MAELKHIVEGDSRLCPAPNASENGKILKVVNGVSSWQAERSEGMQHSEFTSLDPDTSSLADVITLLKGQTNA